MIRDDLKVRIRKLRPDARMPTYGSDGAACFDLYAAGSPRIIADADAPAISTGLAFEIPEGYVMLVFSRSGHGFKHATRLANCVGVIDADYRGEVQVKLVREYAVGGHYLDVIAGDRIAQAMVIPYPRVSFVEVDELSDTERGAGGFGSTGK